MITVDNPREIIRCMFQIWQLYKRQEPLFHEAMCLEMPFRCRRVLGRGYMIHSFLKNDIWQMYQETKCGLNDSELPHTVLRPDEEYVGEQDGKTCIDTLLDGQQDLLAAYETLLMQYDHDTSEAGLCQEHLEKLSEFARSLAEQSARLCVVV